MFPESTKGLKVFLSPRHFPPALLNGYRGYYMNYALNHDGADVKAHVLVKGRTATITIPSHNTYHNEPEHKGKSNLSFGGFTIKVKCSVNRNDNDIFVKPDLSTTQVSPASVSMSGTGSWWTTDLDNKPVKVMETVKSTVTWKKEQTVANGNSVSNIHYDKNSREGSLYMEINAHERLRYTTSRGQNPEDVTDKDDDTVFEIKATIK